MPGGPLARVEGRVSIERILDRMADIKINEAHHGPADERRYTYEPTFILRGLTELHLDFTTADSDASAGRHCWLAGPTGPHADEVAA